MYILTTFRGTDGHAALWCVVMSPIWGGGGGCGDSWLRGTAVERRSLTGEHFPCPTLNLQLTSDHLCR